MKEIIKEILSIYKDDNLKQLIKDPEFKEFLKFVLETSIRAAIKAAI